MEKERLEQFIKLSKQHLKGRKSTAPLQQFFSRLITDNIKIPLTTDVRNIIPQLAQVENGIFVNMLTHTVDGITPMHFVPDLQFSPKPPSSRSNSKSKTCSIVSMQNPRRRCKTTREDLRVTEITAFMQTRNGNNNSNNKSINSNTATSTRQLSKPQTSRNYTRNFAKTTAGSFTYSREAPAFLRPLPPLKDTDDDIISDLYAGPESSFYLCKKERPVDNLRVIPPEYPPHLIGSKYSIINKNNIISLEDQHCELTDLEQYIKDKSDFFITERNLFRKRVSYQSFYVWKNRYKIHNFDVKIKKLNSINEVIGPGFYSTLNRIRSHFLAVTENMRVFPSSFDSKTEDADYLEMVHVAEESLTKISEATSILVDETARMIAEFFNEIQLTKEMMKLNFEELNDLDAVPPKLQQFISDLKYKTPSLFRNHIREEELKSERQLSKSRESYLPTFFKKVRSMYGGLLLIKCREILTSFLLRFDPSTNDENRPTKFLALYDEEKVVSLSPSRKEFGDWVIQVVTNIKSAFLTEDHKLPLDLISELDPNYDCETENLYELLTRFPEIERYFGNTTKAADAAFEYFDKELDEQRAFLGRLKDIINQTTSFHEMRDTTKLKDLVNTLIQVREELSKKTRNIFHRFNRATETRVDFVADMKPAWDHATKMLDKAMKELKARVINELNNGLFIEIQEKFAFSKEKKKLSKIDVGAFEARCLIYSIMCTTIISAWPEALSDCRAGLDTVSQMYQQTANSSKFTHADCADSFNTNAEMMNVAWVRVQDEEEEINEEDEDEYEYVDEEEDGDE